MLSKTKNLQFKSSHRQILIAVNRFEKTNIKLKRGREIFPNNKYVNWNITRMHLQGPPHSVQFDVKNVWKENNQSWFLHSTFDLKNEELRRYLFLWVISQPKLLFHLFYSFSSNNCNFHKKLKQKIIQVSTQHTSGFVIQPHKQCDQIGRFIGLWATFKAIGNS